MTTTPAYRGGGADGYEAAVLNHFWQQVAAGVDRFDLLRELAEVKIERPDTREEGDCMSLTMTRRVVSFRVVGIAQPKGSTRAFVPKGWTRPIITSANPKAKGWQQLVAEQAQGVAADGLFVGPVALGVAFLLPRPRSLPKRVPHHTKKPDLDKLVRALKDALKGVLYQDDAQVVRLLATKHYAAIGSAPCAVITLAEAAAPAPLPVTLSLEDLFAEEEPAHA